MQDVSSVASLRLVSPGVVTDGVTLFFPQKVMTFLVIVLLITTPTLSAFQVIVCPVFFLNSDANNLDFH